MANAPVNHPVAACSVCGASLQGKYCSACGQQKSGTTVTMKGMFTDLASNLFSLEKSILPTMLRLVWNPEPVISNYWQGNKGYYPSPGKMLVYALTVAGLHLAFVNNKLLGFDVQLENVSAQIAFYIFFLPLFSLASRLAFYKRKNFAFHAVSILYLSTTFLMLLILLNDLFLWMQIDFGAVPGLLFVVLTLCWNARVFYPATSGARIFLYTLLQILMLALSLGTIAGVNLLLRWLAG